MNDADLTDEQRAERDAIIAKAVQSLRSSQLEDVRRVMGTPEGRRVFHRLCWGSALAVTFDREALVMARNVGRAEMAREILGELELAAPASFATMLQESKQ